MFAPLLLSLVVSQAPQRLRWDPRVDIPVSTVLVGGWLASEFAVKKELAQPQCRWCEPNGFDTWVRTAFNPRLVPSADGQHDFHVASNLVGFVALPLAMVGLDALFSARDGTFLETFPVDLLLVLETTFSALVFNQAVKFAVARARPYTIGASADLLSMGGDVADNNLSFFSGHSSLAFGLVSSAATIAYLRGYRLWWLAWVVGIPLATTTAVMRLAADKHWASDVIIGSSIGMIFGMVLPTFLHGRVGPVEARVVPSGSGLAVTGRF